MLWKWKWPKTHCESLSYQPMLPKSCWFPTSLQLLKVLRASWALPQRKWGLYKLSPWVGKPQRFASEGKICDIGILKTKFLRQNPSWYLLYIFFSFSFSLYLRHWKAASDSPSTAWMNGCWSCFVAGRYPLCAGPYHWQRCLQSSCCRVCSAGPQPYWHHWWPWPETLHVCYLDFEDTYSCQ